MQDNLITLIEEPPGGHNHGRKATEEAQTADGSVTGAKLSLDTEAWASADFMREDGFAAVDTSAGTHTGRTYGYQDAGMTTHRGVLHPDEYVNTEVLRRAVEAELGFTVAQLHEVYTRAGGPLPVALRDLRAAIDARLLALSESGANMLKLAEVTGLAYRTVKYALARAREVQA